MPPSRGPDPSPSFKFLVQIKGIEVGRFSECSGLEFEQETFDYKEGGVNSHIHRLPGRFKFSNITLKKGIATDGEPLWKWIGAIVNAANEGKLTSEVTHTLTITLFDVGGRKRLREWVFQDAYPVKWSATALSAEQSAIAIETLTLAHQGMSFAL
jgi:phage tail-like protein